MDQDDIPCTLWWKKYKLWRDFELWKFFKWISI